MELLRGWQKRACLVLMLALIWALASPAAPQVFAQDKAEGGPGESRESPLAIGEVGEVGDYEVSVVSVTPNADQIVLDENMFNEPPAPGNQFFLARIATTYVGAETGTPAWDLNFNAVGDSNSSYTTYNDSCGVVPDEAFNISELFEGGSAEFNVCWQIDSDDADSLVMYVEAAFEFDQEPVWFSLGNEVGVADDSDATPAAARDDTEVDSENDDIVRESSRRDPIPFGSTGIVGDYEVTAVSVTPNADDIVLEENMFNEPPAPGNQFFLVRLAVTYVGTETGSPAWDLSFNAVGDLSKGYTTYNDSCGVVPDEAFSVSELFEGGSAEFNVCWQIDSEDADSLVMYVEPSFAFDDEPVWFSLEEE